MRVQEAKIANNKSVLYLFDELISYLKAVEKQEMLLLQQYANVDINTQDIKEARLRDLKRSYDDNISYENVVHNSRLRLVKEIIETCPALKPILEKIEYTLWSEEKIHNARPIDIMISSDWTGIKDSIQHLVYDK